MLLIKHGKDIISQQFVLNRLADCAIDIYAMTCALSRCSRSIQLQLDSVDHERTMAQVWCVEAADRCMSNNRKIRDNRFNSVYSKYSEISKNLCTAQGVANSNPLNV